MTPSPTAVAPLPASPPPSTGFTPIATAAALPTPTPQNLHAPVFVVHPTETPTSVPTASATPTVLPTAIPQPTSSPTSTASPALSPDATTPIPVSTSVETPSPSPTPLQWTDVEFLRAAPVPIPDGAPEWIYDSDLGIVYGQVEHPDLLLDFTKLEVNRSECNALLYAVGDVGEPTTIPLYGAALMAWWDKYGEDAEVPYFSLLARLTVTEYDAIALDLGIKPYAETYGTEGSNPHAQRKVGGVRGRGSGNNAAHT